MPKRAAPAATLDDLKAGSSDTQPLEPSRVPQVRVVLGQTLVFDSDVLADPDEPDQLRTLAEDLEVRTSDATAEMLNVLLSHAKDLAYAYRPDPQQAATFKLHVMGSLIGGVMSAWSQAHPDAGDEAKAMIKEMLDVVLDQQFPGFVIRSDAANNLVAIPHGVGIQRH